MHKNYTMEKRREYPYMACQARNNVTLVTLHNALLMYHYYYNLLPSSFKNFFQSVASVHSYNTRLASKSTYFINTIKTN